MDVSLLAVYLVLIGLLALLIVMYPRIALLLIPITLLNDVVIKAVVKMPFSLYYSIVVAAATAALLCSQRGVRPLRRDPITSICLVLFALWVAFYSLADLGDYSLDVLASLFIPLAVFVIFRRLVKSRRDAMAALGGIIAAYALLGIDLFPKLYGGIGLASWGYLRDTYDTGSVSVMHSATSVAWLFNFAVALVAGYFVAGHRHQRLYALIGMGFFCLLSTLTFSRGTLVGVVAVVGTILVLQLRIGRVQNALFVVLLGVMAVVIVFLSPVGQHFIEDKSLIRELEMEDSRFWIAAAGVQGIIQAPVFGWGISGSPTHSFILDLPYQFGVPASMLFYYAIYRLYKRNWHLAKSALKHKTPDAPILVGCFVAFSTLALQSVFDPTLRTTAYATIFCITQAVVSMYWQAAVCSKFDISAGRELSKAFQSTFRSQHRASL